jgi:hypothetical protein
MWAKANFKLGIGDLRESVAEAGVKPDVTNGANAG